MTKRSRSSTGALIADRRSKQKLTQSQLYTLSGLRGGPNVISQYESDRRTPSIYAIRKIARALGLSTDELIGAEE
jgi:transcriptional regulator with XRE-family HTH domain